MTARFCHLWTKKTQHWKPTAHHMLEERLYLTVCVTMSQLKRYKWETLSERCHYAHLQTTLWILALLRLATFSLRCCSFQVYNLTYPCVFEPQLLQDSPTIKETQSQACGRSSSVVPYRDPKQIYQHFSSVSHYGYKSLTCYIATELEYQNVPFGTECVCVFCVKRSYWTERTVSMTFHTTKAEEDARFTSVNAVTRTLSLQSVHVHESQTPTPQ